MNKSDTAQFLKEKKRTPRISVVKSKRSSRNGSVASIEKAVG